DRGGDITIRIPRIDAGKDGRRSGPDPREIVEVDHLEPTPEGADENDERDADKNRGEVGKVGAALGGHVGGRDATAWLIVPTVGIVSSFRRRRVLRSGLRLLRRGLRLVGGLPCGARRPFLFGNPLALTVRGVVAGGLAVARRGVRRCGASISAARSRRGVRLEGGRQLPLGRRGGLVRGIGRVLRDRRGWAQIGGGVATRGERRERRGGRGRVRILGQSRHYRGGGRTVLVDPLLQLDHQGRRVRLERLDLGELGGRVRHVLPVLAGRDDRVIFVPERRESGRLREAMLRDGKLDDRAILRRRREGEPHLF